MSGTNVPQHFVQQYTTNVSMLLQQMDSRLRSNVTTGSHVGESAAVVDQVGVAEMDQVLSKFSPMGRKDLPLDRRWCQPSDWDFPQLVDKFDKLRLITDPESTYVKAAVAAAKRQQDRLIINAFFGDAKTGKNGGTTESWSSFSSTQVVPVNHGAASNVGLTVAKLREAKKILMANEVDLDSDEIICALTAEQHDNLLAEAQVISTDFNDRPVLVEGRIQRFLGIRFVHTELIQTDANSYRRVPIYAKSGMYMGLWNDITTDVDQRKDLQGLPWQAYVYMTAGATRLEAKKIVEVKCAE